MNQKQLSRNAQAAAVRSMINDDGRKLTWIKKRYPELADGIAVVEAEASKESKPRGSGSVGHPALPSLRSKQ